MKLKDYRTKRAKDPEYIAAAAKLKLTLDIADRILDLRIERGWSQANLAKQIGATAHFVHALETGNESPNVIILENLAAAFGVTLRVELG